MVKTRVPINSVAVCPLHPHLFVTGGGDAIGEQSVPPVTIPPFIAMQAFLCNRPVVKTLGCKGLLTCAQAMQYNGVLQTVGHEHLCHVLQVALVLRVNKELW